jgi:chemotaxis protein MotB
MKKKVQKKENSERWLLTYSDLITLLMILFVVMYAMSNVDSQKYSQVVKSLSSGFGTGQTIVATGSGGDSILQAPIIPEQSSDSAEKKEMNSMEKEVENFISENSLQDSISTAMEERGFVISFKDNIFFDSGKAEVRNEMKDKLNSIASVLNKMDNYVRVEGHTDNVPISTREFSSNWQLSAIRASNVTEYLIKYAHMAPEKLSSIGYGEYRPIESNDSEAGRSKNRRIDIVLLNSKYNDSEHNVNSK